MHPRMLLAPLFTLATLALASCGTKSNAPTYGSGAGGTPTGPAFNLTFPATGTSQTFTFAATDTGSWIYHCMVHGSATAGMRGTVVVNSTASEDSATVEVGVNSGGTDALVFTPSLVTIKPGGHVRWINLSGMSNHTVTRP